MSKFNFSALDKAFNNITLRERVLIFGAFIIGAFCIIYFWIVEPMMLEQAKLDGDFAQSVKQQHKIESDINEVKLRLDKESISNIEREIKVRKEKLKQLDKRLAVKFIDAKKMPSALSAVLRKSPGVKLLSLTTLPIRAFNGPAKEGDDPDAPIDKNIFYKHTIEIHLSGNYKAIYQYLLNIDAIEGEFYWSALTYNVVDYRSARVMIRIYTLSEQSELVSG